MPRTDLTRQVAGGYKPRCRRIKMTIREMTERHIEGALLLSALSYISACLDVVSGTPKPSDISGPKDGKAFLAYMARQQEAVDKLKVCFGAIGLFDESGSAKERGLGPTRAFCDEIVNDAQRITGEFLSSVHGAVNRGDKP